MADLNKKQRQRWHKALASLHNEENGFLNGDIDLGDNLIAKYQGYIEVFGHDEYMWFVEDSREARVEITLCRYDEESGDEIDLGWDEELTKEANKFLNAA